VPIAASLLPALPILFRRLKNGDPFVEHGWASGALAAATPGEAMASIPFLKEMGRDGFD